MINDRFIKEIEKFDYIILSPVMPANNS